MPKPFDVTNVYFLVVAAAEALNANKPITESALTQIFQQVEAMSEAGARYTAGDRTAIVNDGSQPVEVTYNNVLRMLEIITPALVAAVERNPVRDAPRWEPPPPRTAPAPARPHAKTPTITRAAPSARPTPAPPAPRPVHPASSVVDDLVRRSEQFGRELDELFARSLPPFRWEDYLRPISFRNLTDGMVTARLVHTTLTDEEALRLAAIYQVIRNAEMREGFDLITCTSTESAERERAEATEACNTLVGYIQKRGADVGAILTRLRAEYQPVVDRLLREQIERVHAERRTPKGVLKRLFG